MFIAKAENNASHQKPNYFLTSNKWLGFFIKSIFVVENRDFPLLENEIFHQNKAVMENL